MFKHYQHYDDNVNDVGNDHDDDDVVFQGTSPYVKSLFFPTIQKTS